MTKPMTDIKGTLNDKPIHVFSTDQLEALIDEVGGLDTAALEVSLANSSLYRLSAIDGEVTVHYPYFETDLLGNMQAKPVVIKVNYHDVGEFLVMVDDFARNERAYRGIGRGSNSRVTDVSEYRAEGHINYTLYNGNLSSDIVAALDQKTFQHCDLRVYNKADKELFGVQHINDTTSVSIPSKICRIGTGKRNWEAIKINTSVTVERHTATAQNLVYQLEYLVKHYRLIRCTNMV